MTAESYARRIKEGLERSHKNALQMDLDLDQAKLVIFSDHHKGAGDNADDFRQCQMAYHAAMGYYLESGFTLVDLGDVEELWENWPQPVLDTYPWTLQLENEFHTSGRYWRFWGNHDDLWRDNENQVPKFLGPIFGDLEVWESLRLSVKKNSNDLGELYLAHGHQGTLDSDRFGWLSRIFVRYVWRRIQRATNIRTSTPATDWRLRHRHDIAMYNWAAEKVGIILIAGHTHHPIFPPRQQGARLKSIFEDLQEQRSVKSATGEDLSQLEQSMAETRAELEYVRALEQRLPMDKPCYLNSGCCSFSDGHITGIEITGGQIRLVTWPNEKGEPKPRILDTADLETMLQEVSMPTAPLAVI
jgi:hypothetical protein